MKKFLILFAVTVVCIGVMLLVGFRSGSETVEVKVLSVTPRSAELTISCEGVVQAVKRYDVYAEYPLVAEQITVQVGDRVNEGEVLLFTDAASTRRQLRSAGKLSEDVVETAAKQVIKAPVSGVVTAINVSEGGATDTQKPCFSIDGTDALQVLVSVEEKDVRSVKLGQKARVSGNAFSKEFYSGTVTRISSVAHMVGGKTMLDAVVTLMPIEQDTSLRLGLNADVELIAERLSACFILPYEALEEDESFQEYVYVIEEGKAVKREILTGEALEDGVVITSGLVEGDQVVVSPRDIAKEGVSVRVKGEN